MHTLKDHLLERLEPRASSSSDDADSVKYTEKDRERVMLSNGRMYLHGTLRVNYTSYDV